MKISDLNESSYQKDLNSKIMDVLMMFHKTGASQTDINNVISELNKHDISVTEEDITDLVNSSKTLSVTSDGKIILDPNAEADTQGEPAVSDAEGEEYNPARDKAKQATLKRLRK